MKRPTARCAFALLLLVASCTSLGGRQAGEAPPPVWALGADRFVELYPEVGVRTYDLPMYGGTDRSEGPIAAADGSFVNGVAEEVGSRERGARIWVERGFEHYLRDEYALAVRRFNQAWLLDPENPDVYHGFAVVYADHANGRDALAQIERALALGLAGPGPLADAAYIIAMEAAQRAGGIGGGRLPASEAVAVAERTEALLVRAREAVETPDQREYVEQLGLLARLATGAYDGAWESLDRLEEMGGSVPRGARHDLERLSPR